MHPDDWDKRFLKLQQDCSVCEKCNLAKTRTKVVFGEGNPKSPLVFVGEGPGQTEDATGRPFVGKAGQLLDECLAANGMTRKHVYICNIVKCRACTLEHERLKNRPPSEPEISACSEFLSRQLTLLSPLVIVCLGSSSANTLIHSNFRITIERGKWFETTSYAKAILATLHPAYILRQEGLAYKQALEHMLSDIGNARKKVIDIKKALAP